MQEHELSKIKRHLRNIGQSAALIEQNHRYIGRNRRGDTYTAQKFLDGLEKLRRYDVLPLEDEIKDLFGKKYKRKLLHEEKRIDGCLQWIQAIEEQLTKKGSFKGKPLMPDPNVILEKVRQIEASVKNMFRIINEFVE